MPPGEIMERSDTLESQPGLAGNDENVSKVLSSCWKWFVLPQRLRGVSD